MNPGAKRGFDSWRWNVFALAHLEWRKVLALYRSGRLLLDELITQRYTIDEAPQAFSDLAAGKNARGVIVFS